MHRASSDSLATDLVAYPPHPPPPIAASVPSPSSLMRVFLHPIPSSKRLFLMISQYVSEYCHPIPTHYPACALLSVNQSVSQLIVLINFSVSTWVSAATLPLPPTRCVSLGHDPFNQNFRKFWSKTQWIGSVQPEKFQKNGFTFWGGPIFPVGLVGIFVEWIMPLLSVNQPVSQLIVLANFSVSKWVMSAATLPYHLPSVCPSVSQPVCKSVDSAHQLLCQ